MLGWRKKFDLLVKLTFIFSYPMGLFNLIGEHLYIGLGSSHGDFVLDFLRV